MATIQVGPVITGDPGTDAQVINIGDENNAIFEFVIPRGEPGGGGTLDVLATVDPSSQSPAAGGNLIFTDVPLVVGNSIAHNPGDPQVQILQPGIYQATFSASVTPNSGTSIPALAEVQMNLNGTMVPGAIARHSFTASSEVATVSFSMPFRVTGAPEYLEMVVNQDGFSFQDAALTVVRLGDG